MIKVLGKRVLIEEVVEDIKSAGGIILGDTKTSAQRTGRVISVGNLVEEIKVNDKVMFDGYRVAPLDFDGNTYLIMEENNVIGVYL
jgi:chaperonin GroES